MFTLVRLVQPENTPLAIDVTLSGIVMLARLVHWKNADVPIDSTLSGMVTLIRLAQRLNAWLLIVVSWLSAAKVTVVRESL